MNEFFFWLVTLGLALVPVAVGFFCIKARRKPDPYEGLGMLDQQDQAQRDMEESDK